MNVIQDEREIEVAAQIDMEYLARVAESIAASLTNGWPAQVAFQPGDGTFYGLVFTPLWEITPVEAAAGTSETQACRGMPPRYGATLVSYVDHNCYPLDLGPERGYLHWSYISEKFFGNSPTSSAVTLTLLFRAISESMVA